ncbi:MAG: glutamyl-tRNA reductase [Acidaminococcaceae bacterium]|jgi:glutamyl-tRNA reductase|nr:glutamyl-tRNA reductase [Acidaminococcaceae bacterium]MBP3811685.1 glutamyl-tRNA reductase [Acidaminococcaceae bacterium]MBR1493795.1 glutamyl-tRNA reductase [Acidaminococcaceae bacterium]MBR1661389.1 glutamyl-tRNA reductase [Acidaminococcaceae bacterium]HAT98681.1 glutamyl-tRNA reductase [Acidaminococcaceae bacterium]
MQLIVLGLNHKTAPVEIREKFNFSRSRIKHILRLFRESDDFSETVLVSTCNRTELYLVAQEPEDGMASLQIAVKRIAGKTFKSEYFYTLTGVHCVRHLLLVASSLDSLIVGEGQILSQVKDAYHLARTAGTTSTLFNTIFNQAITTGKRIRTRTQIAYRSVSVSSAAVDLAMKVVGDLSKADILVIGAGKMSELTARHLLDKGAPSIFVTNRSYDHAQELAAKFNGSVIRFDDFIDHAVNADIVITSTGAPHYIIQRDRLALALEERQKANPLVLIDIAVPRDVDPEVTGLKNVVLYNIDDLQNVVDTNKELRNQDAEAAKTLIEEDILALKERLRYLSLRPVMVRLHDKFDFLRERIVAKTLKKMPELTEEQQHKIEVMSERLMYKFLRDPMININKAAGTEEEEHVKKDISRFFMLNDKDEDEPDDEKNYNYWN